MISWIKRHFIPHEGNGHRPHFLHRQNVKQLMGVVLLFELLLFILPAANFLSYFESLNLGAVLPGVLSSLTNAERLQNNLPELKESETLNRAAQLKAEDMAKKSYFAHTSPEGKTPWSWLESVGYKYVYAGENLAVHFVDSQDVTKAWMNSPSHRANIIHGAYTEVGTGVATGTYQGFETVFVAQVYGRPAYTTFGTAPRAVPTRSADNNSPGLPPTENVLGDSKVKTTGLKQAAEEFLEGAASSPRHTVDAVLWSVVSLLALALLSTIFIKIKHQHPDLILNGAMAIAVVLALHMANIYISQNRPLQTTFIAYDTQNQTLSQE